MSFGDTYFSLAFSRFFKNVLQNIWFIYFMYECVTKSFIIIDGFAEYITSGGETTYQQLCSEITVEFSDCSKQVREMESQFLKPFCFRDDLAQLLRAVQELEKQKLHLTANIQVLKKAGRPSERLVTHENCSFKSSMRHECVHVHELTDAAGTEEAEADAEYDNAIKEAIKGVQEAVTSINEYLEEVRYEIDALESE
ncbi:Protein Daple [Bienertia sinuspersici]